MESFIQTLFRHVVSILTELKLRESLEKEFDKRPSPEQIQNHPWVQGMQQLRSVDMERWIKEAWGWR
jgi:hypothetical protein